MQTLKYFNLVGDEEDIGSTRFNWSQSSTFRHNRNLIGVAVEYTFAIQTNLSVHGAAYLITLTYFTTLFTILFSKHYPMWGPQVNDLIQWVRADVRCCAPPSAVSVSPKSTAEFLIRIAVDISHLRQQGNTC